MVSNHKNKKKKLNKNDNFLKYGVMISFVSFKTQWETAPPQVFIKLFSQTYVKYKHATYKINISLPILVNSRNKFNISCFKYKTRSRRKYPDEPSYSSYVIIFYLHLGTSIEVYYG